MLNQMQKEKEALIAWTKDEKVLSQAAQEASFRIFGMPFDPLTQDRKQLIVRVARATVNGQVYWQLVFHECVYYLLGLLFSILIITGLAMFASYFP